MSQATTNPSKFSGMDVNFSHSYECDQLAEIPNSALPHYYFPDTIIGGGRDGTLVAVRPEHGEPWLGTFAFGRVSPRGFSGIFATPNPQRVCVVAKGEGYFVTASEPKTWESLGINPITDVRTVKTHGIIVFANFTGLWAYGSTGLKWETRRLASDGLKITEITGTSILGEFWDVPNQATGSFRVDLMDGTHKFDA